VIVCAAASPSIDKLFVVQELAPGCVHRPAEFLQVAGGKALNVARAVAALGGEALIVALVGGHAGRWVVDALHGERLPARFAWTEPETRASLSVADRATASLTEFYEAGGGVDAAGWGAFVEEVTGALEGASWLAVSGSLPLGAPPAAYAEMVGDTAERGVSSALDARGVALEAGLAGGPELVKINDGEAAEVLGFDVSSAAAALEAARSLRARAGGEGKAAVVTRGVEGAVMIAPDGSEWEGRLGVRGPYPVGSGDAFLAGLLVGLEAASPWPDALALALAAATANAEQAGAGRLERDRPEQLVSRAEVWPLS
jgi:1-phosphofructokinase family hexose kinase